MNKEYTPGPWKTAQRTTRGEFVTETHIFASDGSHIANVSPCQIDANARLIAAAPELLMALEDAILAFEEQLGTDCECDNTHEVNGTVCRLCFWRAIAKKAKVEGTE